MIQGSREFWKQYQPVDIDRSRRNEAGVVDNYQVKVRKIRSFMKYYHEEIDRAEELILNALKNIEDGNKLLEVENTLREATTAIHNARVCLPSKEELQEVAIYDQGLRQQKENGKKIKRRYFKL